MRLVPSAAGARYDLYLSYDPSVKEVVGSIVARLEGLGKRCFDENQVTGEAVSRNARRRWACRSASRWSSARRRRPVRTRGRSPGAHRAIEGGARAFYLFLPAPIRPRRWTNGSSSALSLDLRERFDRVGLSFDGLVELVAAVEGVPSIEVRGWVKDQIGEPVARARAVIVTVKDYEHFDDLASAAADRTR